MASAFCSQLRQYVKQLVSNPQPCLVNQTARLHVGDASNRFYSLLHSWSAEKPPESPRKQAAASLPFVLTVNELKFVVLRDDVAVPLQSPRSIKGPGCRGQLKARPHGSEHPRAKCHQQKEACEKARPKKPNYANPEPEPGNKPNPEVEASPQPKPPQSPTQPGDRRHPVKPTGTYSSPSKFYVVKSPMAKMNEPVDFTRRNSLGASSRNLSTLAANNTVTKSSIVEAVNSSQIKGFHASAIYSKDKKGRDRDKVRDKERDKEKERTRREKDRTRSVYGEHVEKDEDMREEKKRPDEREGRVICVGKMPDPPKCPEGCRAGPSRKSDSRRTSGREPDSHSDASMRESDSRRGTSLRKSESKRDGSVREPDSHSDASMRESDSRRGTSLRKSDSKRDGSVREPEWRRKASIREPHSRRVAAPVKEPRSGDERPRGSKCSGNEPWKRECPGSNRLRKCPGGSCGRGGDRDPDRKAFSSYALRSRTKLPLLNDLKVSKSEVSRSIGSSDVIYAKKKDTCDDKYSSIKDKKRRMKLMEKELDEIKNCIESVKCKLRRSPKEEKGPNKKS